MMPSSFLCEAQRFSRTQFGDQPTPSGQIGQHTVPEHPTLRHRQLKSNIHEHKGDVSFQCSQRSEIKAYYLFGNIFLITYRVLEYHTVRSESLIIPLKCVKNSIPIAGKFIKMWIFLQQKRQVNQLLIGNFMI
jgi:hypothetical protein